MIKRLLFLVAIVSTMLFATTYGEKVAGAESAKFFVDSRIVSIRTLGSADRFVDVTYSGYNWDTTGAPDQTAQVTVDDEETLKSSTGEGVVRWVPKTAEVHTLKHICNGATLIATFDVEGPTVKINRQKDASNRNTIYCEIVCDAPGAVIYYTTDGTNPTVESLVYTGPFIVNPIGGSIVKAMAIAEGYPQSRPVAVNFAPLGIEVVASASSGEFKVDGRAGTGEEIVSEGTENLTFSNQWDGDADATVTIAQDGAAIFSGLTGEGVKTWSVNCNGRYVLTHTTYTNGVAGKVETAVFVVEGKDVPVGKLTIDWGQSSFVYDGQPKEPVVTVKDGATTLTKATHYLVEYKDNVNVGTAKAIVKGIEPYVGAVTNEFTITKGTIPGGGGEPGTGEIPEGGLSKFDATYVYDGEGHTIKTNELVAAYKVSLVGEFVVSYAVGGSGGQELPALPPTDVGAWGTVAPVYTNVGEYVIWYKVTSANYEDFVHQAKVTITPKPLAVTAEAKTQVYGTAAKPLTYTVDGLIAGDALTGALTRELGNGAGEYDILQGTLANGNYTISYTGAKYTITKAKYPGQETGGAGIQWNVAADAATWMYDGETHGITLTGVPNGVTPHLTGNAAKDVGEYTASVTFDFDTANYEAPKVPAPLAWSITKRPLSLQTVSVEKPYDGFPLMVEKANITPGLSGYAEGECFDYFDLASITEVGETPATFQYRDSATAKVSNYAVSVVGGATLKVTVGGDQISVTAKDGVWAYDGTGHRLAEWTIVNGDKLLAGHAFQIKISDDSVVTTPRDGVHADGIVSNRFEYVKIVETKSGADKTKNYNLFVYEGTLQMTNRVICSEELRVNGEEFGERIEKTYDGRATNVTVTAELLQPATVRYGESVDDISSTTEPEFTDAGEYVVWYTVAADYYNVYTNKVVVKINPRPITLTSPTKAKPYDGTALTFGAQELEVTYTGGALGDRALPDGESLVFSNFASIVDAGRVDATFDYAAGVGTKLDNYEVTVKKGTLTVNASADEITLTAKSGSWPYDATAHTLHAYDVENGDVLRPGDELVVEYDEASVVETPDDGEIENVITSVRVMRTTSGQQQGEDVTRNYSIVTYPGKIKVVNATIRSEELRVKSEECVYDGEGHTIEVEANGLLTSPATVTYSATGEGAWKRDPMAVAVTNAGTHTIRYRVSAKYYDDYFGEATVAIAPRPVTLVSAGARKVFDGTPLRRDVVTVKSGSLDFADGEGVTTRCTSSQTGVGRIENGFDYTFNEGTLRDNYTITLEFGWLEVTPGTLTVDLAASGHVGTYDGAPHGVSLVFDGVGLNLDACEVTYALVAGDESAYGTEMPTFTDVGIYTVYVKIKAQNFEVFYGEVTVEITRASVALPEIPSKVYNGTKQTADVPASARYTVRSNSGGTAVGAYNVLLTLTDAANYSWSDGTTSSKVVKFQIVKAENEWITFPSITGWRAGEAAHEPVAAAKYGEVAVSYSGTTADGEVVTDALAVAKPGIYTAHFAVPETTSWSGLAENVVFTVAASGAGGVEPASFKAMGYLGEYDGRSHTITVEVIGGDGSFTVAYAESQEGPWSNTAPSYVAAGEYTVWYRVSSPNYASVSGSAKVKIVEGAGGGVKDWVDVPMEIGGTAFQIPFAWFAAQPGLGAKFGTDWERTAFAKTGKRGSDGAELCVWHDFVAGTDPTNVNSRLTANIRMENGAPVVTWRPALNGEGVKRGARIYRVDGKVKLDDGAWTPDVDERKGTWRFFRVRVEMP